MDKDSNKNEIERDKDIPFLYYEAVLKCEEWQVSDRKGSFFADIIRAQINECTKCKDGSDEEKLSLRSSLDSLLIKLADKLSWFPFGWDHDLDSEGHCIPTEKSDFAFGIYDYLYESLDFEHTVFMDIGRCMFSYENIE